ncbi:MAG: hypothetical protein JWO86_7097, partial [Myxococcaceae bacterium]|nr:hypothetical protein [Myxococcaceae bacterium]
VQRLVARGETRGLVLELLLEHVPRREDLADRLALDGAARRRDRNPADRRFRSCGSGGSGSSRNRRRSGGGGLRPARQWARRPHGKRRRCSRGGFHGQRRYRRRQSPGRRGLDGRSDRSERWTRRTLCGALAGKRTVRSSNAGLLACSSSHGRFYEHALGQPVGARVAQLFGPGRSAGGDPGPFRWTKDDPVDGCRTQATSGTFGSRGWVSDASWTCSTRCSSTPSWSRVTCVTRARTISSRMSATTRRAFSRSRNPSNALPCD